MNEKVLVGLTFFADNSFAKKIDSFRSRHDLKYAQNPDLYLPLLPPFEMKQSEITSLGQSLSEELEGFFYQKDHHHLEFVGLDVYEYKRTKLLYLKPKFSQEVRWCQESLLDICQAHIWEKGKRIKSDDEVFLTIGRFQSEEALHLGIRQAQDEFTQFENLTYQSISLFLKKNDRWQRQTPLINFEKSNEDV